MSIIADALRKTGSPSIAPPPSPKSRWVYQAIALGCLVFALFVLSRSPRGMSNTPATEGKTRSVPSAASTTAQPAGPSQPIGLNLLRIADGQWRLNGTVRGGPGKPLALINGQVIEEGGSVQGAKLVRVTDNAVDLEANGQVKTVNMQ